VVWDSDSNPKSLSFWGIPTESKPPGPKPTNLPLVDRDYHPGNYPEFCGSCQDLKLEKCSSEIQPAGEDEAGIM